MKYLWGILGGGGGLRETMGFETLKDIVSGWRGGGGFVVGEQREEFFVGS